MLTSPTYYVYTFIKEPVYENNMDEMMTRLSNFGLSLSAYQTAYQLEEIVPKMLVRILHVARRLV